MLKTRTPKQTEHQLQMACAAWLMLQEKIGQILMFWHTPNGGLRSMTTAKRLKTEGVRSGVADLTILYPNGRTSYVELKSQAGKLSQTQNEFHSMIVAHGSEYAVVRSIDELIRHVSAVKMEPRRW